ncbi:2Fe-2S ferredoxin [Salpingoeca rosetta]|uniref:2Fe-2S ferredoxin n=1 Tax=Salpingoeca rosetta (strain ATCC 50818 / BSB-021) TaxID=946362 RepID=F2U871_SALR5|nr:2Fe-2S ferredoxin [Salpingoeca rosetta]EGD72579.1 2Fe-2S ferredoxin [Salpingoeca rosetta]|eukprot:XP_004994402.1 2Fe-2S ferredoxin [Salpingoeca rosetta]
MTMLAALQRGANNNRMRSMLALVRRGAAAVVFGGGRAVAAGRLELAALAPARSVSTATTARWLRTAPATPHRTSPVHSCSSSSLMAPTRARLHTTRKALAKEDKVRVVFKDTEGGSQVCEARVGQNLLDVAIDNDIDLEGACGGTLACSTCHLIIDEEWFKKLEEPVDEELDMLDLAIGLTDTSRLGCQIILSPELDGIEVTLPDEQNDLRQF